MALHEQAIESLWQEYLDDKMDDGWPNRDAPLEGQIYINWLESKLVQARQDIVTLRIALKNK